MKTQFDLVKVDFKRRDLGIECECQLCFTCALIELSAIAEDVLADTPVMPCTVPAAPNPTVPLSAAALPDSECQCKEFFPCGWSSSTTDTCTCAQLLGRDHLH